MVESDIVNAVSTAVIALSTAIGVLSTLDYYLFNIQGMRISIVILISLIYIISVVGSMKYIKRRISK